MTIPAKSSNLKAQTLTFNRNEVSRALTHTLKASRRSPHDDQDPASVPAGLILVSGHGIYLMSNGRNAEGQHGRKACPVAYALEANPDTLPFNDWWAVKEQAGCGDWTMFLPADEIRDWLAQTFANPQLEAEQDSEGESYITLKDDLHAPELT